MRTEGTAGREGVYVLAHAVFAGFVVGRLGLPHVVAHPWQVALETAAVSLSRWSDRFHEVDGVDESLHHARCSRILRGKGFELVRRLEPICEGDGDPVDQGASLRNTRTLRILV